MLVIGTGEEAVARERLLLFLPTSYVRPSIGLLADPPDDRPGEAVLLTQLVPGHAALSVGADRDVAPGVPAQVGVVVPDDVGDRVRVASHDLAHIGVIEILGDQARDLLVEF